MVVLHVDHGLRAESAREAEWLRREVAQMGLGEGFLVARMAPLSAPPSHQSLRDGRLSLLDRMAVQARLCTLLTAHHADDVAETQLQRIHMASAVAGHARLISPTLHLPQLHLPVVRPLLAFRKQDLIDFLNEEGQTFIEDPSNRNPRYQRSRIRTAMQQAPAELFDDLASLRQLVQTEWEEVETRSRLILARHLVAGESLMSVQEFGRLLRDRRHWSLHVDGVAAWQALHTVLSRLKGTVRLRSSLVDHLAEWIVGLGRTDLHVATWSQAKVTARWSRKQDRVDFVKC